MKKKVSVTGELSDVSYFISTKHMIYFSKNSKRLLESLLLSYIGFDTESESRNLTRPMFENISEIIQEIARARMV